MVLDLHGLNVENATAQIITSLFSFYNDLFLDELTVITGNGSGVIAMTFLNLIEQESHKFNCSKINNGAFLVTKNY